MKKRTLSILVAAVMTIGMLAGCGSNHTNTTGTTDTGGAETKTDAVADGQADAVTEAQTGTQPEDQEAAAAEPVTLNVAYMPNYGSLWSIENAIAQGYL